MLHHVRSIILYNLCMDCLQTVDNSSPGGSDSTKLKDILESALAVIMNAMKMFLGRRGRKNACLADL